MKRDLVDLSRPVIEPYKPAQRGIAHDGVENTPQERWKWAKKVKEHGGFNPALKTWTPLHGLQKNETWLHDVLDHITAACESGQVERYGWSNQLFAKPADLKWFLEAVRYYDEAFRITDRWWHALASLAGVVDEEGFISCEQIADSLEEAAKASKTELKRLALQAKYLERNPSAPLQLDGQVAKLVVDHNTELRMQQPAQWWDTGHFTNKIEFVNRFHYLKGDELRTREATADDVAGLVHAAGLAKADGKEAPRRTTRAKAK